MHEKAPSSSARRGDRLRRLWAMLGDLTRLRILALLQKQELSVAEICEVLQASQPAVSGHLALLRSEGLVCARRQGRKTFYSLPPEREEAEARLSATALLLLEESGEADRDPERLRKVIERRKEETRAHFNRMAGRLGGAPCPGRGWPAVGPLLARLLSPVVIADLGCGEGWLSQLLAERAERVIAVDISPKMVAFAAQEAKKRNFANLEFRVGDLQNPPIPLSSVDIAVLSQALHHAPNPAQAIAAASRILRPGGTLAILDLSEHSFEDARSLYGDYWLGFSESELEKWLSAAGFTKIRIQPLDPDPAPPHLRALLVSAIKPIHPRKLTPLPIHSRE
ncbi:putative S-adenosylmethionine-dependent methyltransferase/MSMEI_2290 [Methylacidimicrobium cyclopophantes]|uniref:S-adenosylmethionine-dependent methyltransferase/MSMEI_2290 n=1 Tax=Methylacidimicrobium cyclopophantes TaxID=1041766 RepID=A0A5E6M463_9BACT|nr:metalloregulator ArsR/SmtB family transcription factor [Methylacidimicrobium cyclopophantes]VVM04368.1 putative S-adenosylmethionine-dependent methyltransferase/MSMEI_2290 [Methylacidimicrobium cyclopophantes]